MSNIATVQELYAAFGRGDIPSILERVTESVEWGYDDPSTEVPWLQPRKGRAGVADFFEAFALLQMNSFRPKVFLETGNVVVAIVDEDVTVKATGKGTGLQEQVHIWKFDERGRITAHYWQLDTHRHWSAYRG
jgi:ketosteroid isomerase-like protein